MRGSFAALRMTPQEQRQEQKQKQEQNAKATAKSKGNSKSNYPTLAKAARMGHPQDFCSIAIHFYSAIPYRFRREIFNQFFMRASWWKWSMM